MPCGYDNADKESGGHSFNVEAINGERFLTRTAAKYQYSNISKSIIYALGYNRKRLHSTLGYVSPESFEGKKVA